jgi:hypothetical protein
MPHPPLVLRFRLALDFIVVFCLQRRVEHAAHNGGTDNHFVRHGVAPQHGHADARLPTQQQQSKTDDVSV